MATAISRSKAGEPFVRIQVVADQTGVAEGTLRAWERRYGILRPQRTAGGFRLYSRTDIERVRSMQTLCESGFSPAEAARHVLADQSFAQDSFTGVRASLMASISKFDVAGLDRGIHQLVFHNDAITVAEKIVAPLMKELGELWSDGRVSVAEEHFATQYFSAFLRQLVRIFPIDGDAPRVLMASVDDDEHDLGLHAVALRVAQQGWRPIVLGPRTPPLAIRNAMKSIAPSYVALSMTGSKGEATANELMAAYARAIGKIPWVIGGRAAPEVQGAVTTRGGRVDAPSLDIGQLLRRSERKTR